MEDLVIMKNKQAVTTSLQVAESFGKKHQHVMEAIRKLTVENSTVGNMFVKSTYFNKQNHEQPIQSIVVNQWVVKSNVAIL